MSFFKICPNSIYDSKTLETLEKTIATYQQRYDSEKEAVENTKAEIVKLKDVLKQLLVRIAQKTYERLQKNKLTANIDKLFKVCTGSVTKYKNPKR